MSIGEAPQEFEGIDASVEPEFDVLAAGLARAAIWRGQALPQTAYDGLFRQIVGNGISEELQAWPIIFDEAVNTLPLIRTVAQRRLNGGVLDPSAYKEINQMVNNFCGLEPAETDAADIVLNMAILRLLEEDLEESPEEDNNYPDSVYPLRWI